MAGSEKPARQLLIDVSVLSREDARTGIQRVVREIWKALSQIEIAGLDIRPVFATRTSGFTYASNDFLQVGQAQTGGPVAVTDGDIFLALDFSPAILPLHENQLQRWKAQGVRLSAVLYDMLPTTNPRWFGWRSTHNFRRWLGCITRQVHQILCISDDVRNLIETRLSRPRLFARHQRIDLETIMLSGAIDESLLANIETASDDPVAVWTSGVPTVLLVGTIEPRKGHDVTLSAFEQIWRDRPDAPTKLLMVGKRGWKTEKLQRRILQHPEFGKRLLWAPSVSDALLVRLYDLCAGVIVPSYAEGFGLPIAEALFMGKSVLARDVPVVRAFRSPHLLLFEDDRPAPLAVKIEDWLERVSEGFGARERGEGPSWADAARSLLAALPLDEEIASRVSTSAR